MTKILVIDDEDSIRNTLQEILEYEKYEVDLAPDGNAGLEYIKQNSYDVILCDIKMPGLDGVEVLERVIRLQPDAPVIMISGHGNIDTAVDAIKKGAYDFIEKPLDLNRLLITIKNALDKSTLVEETKRLKQKVTKSHQMIGESPALVQVKTMIERVGPTDARVLITGENGTGKELVARQLHDMSARQSKPFIEVNCAAIPSELIESELFGHEKGAFTSAHKQRKGKFEQAQGGTLFLDEIGDMSLSAQSKVLRALQENKISRVGSDKDIDVDVRIFAATNKNMELEIKENRFREDLYHRISVILIHVPPLRERLEDIPGLSKYFIQQIADEYNSKPIEITEKAIAELQKLPWTGNIREFRNVIERLMILSNTEITENDVKAFAHPLSTTKN
ncbi:MAG: response regulator [Salinivirgaceae bacterium]|nr:MAG: response regulator [Salinivirgaceae bacterium]